MSETVVHWIDGKLQDDQSGRTDPVFNPATGVEKALAAATARSK